MSLILFTGLCTGSRRVDGRQAEVRGQWLWSTGAIVLPTGRKYLGAGCAQDT